jgi:hypothetical protein
MKGCAPRYIKMPTSIGKGSHDRFAPFLQSAVSHAYSVMHPTMSNCYSHDHILICGLCLLQNFRAATNIKALEEICKLNVSDGSEPKILVLVDRFLEPILRAQWQLRQENPHREETSIFDYVDCDFVVRSSGRKSGKEVKSKNVTV